MTRFIGIFLFLAAMAGTVLGANDRHRAVEIEFLYGRDELFPSLLVSLTATSTIAPQDKAQRGDPRGVIAARVVAPTDNCTVRVTLAATPFFAESSVAVILPRAGAEYRIAPTIRFNNAKLAAVKQPVPNLVIKVTVVFDPGGPNEAREEVYRRVIVRSIRDCVTGYRLRGYRADGSTPDGALDQTPLSLAAYVNENHPVLDQTITKHALDRPGRLVNQFIGYIGQSNKTPDEVDLGKRSVRREVHAIYDSLQLMGFRYADLGAPPHTAEAANGVATRSVRLVGEIVESGQANELEVAIVIASVLRKLSVDTELYVARDRRTLLGVFLTRDRDTPHRLFLAPQYLGEGRSFDDAVRRGKTDYLSSLRLAERGAQAEPRLIPAASKSDKLLALAGLWVPVWPLLSSRWFSDKIPPGWVSQRYVTVNLDDARKSGVLPIPERR